MAAQMAGNRRDYTYRLQSCKSLTDELQIEINAVSKERASMAGRKVEKNGGNETEECLIIIFHGKREGQTWSVG